MAEARQQRSAELGVTAHSAPSRRRAVSTGEMAALVLSLVWLVGCAVFFVFLRAGEGGEGLSVDALRLVLTLLAVFMPVAIIWVATAATRSARIMREESERLQAAIDALRHTYLQQMQSGVMARGTSAVERKLDQIVRAQRQTETAIATFTSIRPGPSVLASSAVAAKPENRPKPDEPPVEQGTLALGTPAEAVTPPLPVSDYIRALHFPENAEDREGFRALRRALQDRQVAGLVQAAQDVLTLLSQDGIYMDDLKPDRARPEVWRRFALGERGRAIAALGGVRDRSSLALTAGRMRTDSVFRDAAHHFLRRFDHGFTRFEKTASDQDIAALADTRSARAFMLLGRVTGIFD
jgi:hypothetical protein